MSASNSSQFGPNAVARARIADQRIPIIDDGLVIEMRKDGPLSITRHADVYFPAEWVGDTSYIEGINEDYYTQGVIEIHDPTSSNDTYRTVLRGHVTSMGTTGRNTAHARIADPAMFFNAIGITETFDATDTVASVLDAIQSKMILASPIYNQIQIDIRADGSTTVIPESSEVSMSKNVKRFVRNRDTLMDVLNWVQERTAFVFFIEPTGDGKVRLVVDDDPYREYKIGGPDSIPVYANNALASLNPVNTVTVVGSSKFSQSIGNFDLNLPLGGKDFPAAIATATKLKERADGRRRSVRVERDVRTKASAENAAKIELKKKLDSPSGGLIAIAYLPQLRPYDKVRVNALGQPDKPRFIYEVERLRHIFRADSDEPYRTEMEVSLFTAFEDIDTQSQLLSVEDKSESLTDLNETITGNS